jgi:hypothetical protein
MLGFIAKLFRILNRDITGLTWTREISHPYFGALVYFGSKKPSECYWEAELSHSELSKKIGVTMQGTPEGPEDSEEAFCRSILADLDTLFEKCRTVFESELSNWSDKPFPTKWREEFVLDGFSIPLHGDPSKPWEVTYFVKPAKHYFTAQFADGRVHDVQVDG